MLYLKADKKYPQNYSKTV